MWPKWWLSSNHDFLILFQMLVMTAIPLSLYQWKHRMFEVGGFYATMIFLGVQAIVAAAGVLRKSGNEKMRWTDSEKLVYTSQENLRTCIL